MAKLLRTWNKSTKKWNYFIAIYYEFQRELFRLCWGPRHSQIVFWGISVSWIWPDIKNVWTFFQNNKSPLEDGFSKEFYETFFDLIGTYLLNSYNEAFTKGQLSISQRRGVICLISKEDSCLIELHKWRPLTLLNVDYKILAKAIGQRIESMLSSIIHSDQTGFIKLR